jgi:glutaredoxin
MTRLTLYTKPDCCLCDDARDAIHRVQRETAFQLEEVDITSDSALAQEYGERIPVVLVNGVAEFEYRVDESELRRKIAGPVQANVRIGESVV